MRTFLGGVFGKVPRPTPAMAVALLALLVAASGAAVAAGSFTASDGTITACRDNKSGVLRVIQSGQTCNTSKETTITWKDGITGTVANAANADKLDNKDSTEFLGKPEKAADSELLDGIDSSSFAAYKRTVVVSPVGTDTQNGQALLDAISNITDASASKPYLLHIEPATYDLGNGSLNMKSFVDIEGSGELNTVIRSVVGACNLGTVNGADNAEMRFLTVRNTGANGCKSAINNQSTSPRLTHLTAEAIGVGGSNNFGVQTTNSSTTMTDVTATASGQTGAANYGVYSSQSNLTIKQSKLTGSGGAFENLALRIEEGTTAKVALSQLVGGTNGSDGDTLQCFNNYNENMAEVTCTL